jgi:hypothetical protein
VQISVGVLKWAGKIIVHKQCRLRLGVRAARRERQVASGKKNTQVRRLRERTGVTQGKVAWLVAIRA